MNRIYAFYDQRCGLCERCRAMLANEPQLVPITFLPYQSPAALTLCPMLLDLQPGRQIVTMTDTGNIYQGERSWILLLWATDRWRELSLTLAKPSFNGLVKRAVDIVSRHRLTLSRLLLLKLRREAP